MRDSVQKILENSDCLPEVSWKKGPNSSELILNQKGGKGHMLFYPLFPGITLAFVSVNSPNWPESDLNSQIKPLLINYCVLGRSELLLDDGTYVYLKENDFSVSQQTAQKEYLFPTGHYQGIKLYIEAELLPRDIMEAFEIDFIHLKELYLKKRPTYINQTEGELASVFQKLWEFYQAPCAFYMKCCTLELLYKLLTCEIAPSKTCEFYTATQVAIAKKAKLLLTADLKKHYPIRLLSQDLSVSETSLKNYFRGVYGQNISLYLREIRMNTAAKMLTETDLSIAEIAVEVGYSNQGKFAAVFRRYFQMNPLEYRRARRLETL